MLLFYQSISDFISLGFVHFFSSIRSAHPLVLPGQPPLAPNLAELAGGLRLSQW
jgi:hypothetical protein